MIIHTKLEKIQNLKKPIFLTIGMFDGLHLGHSKILNYILENGKTSVVITYNKHPLSIINPTKTPKNIFSLKHKLDLFEKMGIDIVFVLDFDDKFSKLSYRDFIFSLKSYLNFSTLVLGKGASFGYKNQGDEKNIKKLSEKLKFNFCYLDLVKYENRIISSSILRKLIKNGYMRLVKSHLKRPYDLILKNEDYILDNEKIIITNKSLCIPKEGLYDISLFYKNALKRAKLEIQFPILKLKSYNSPIDLSKQTIKIIFE
jgi:FAD synthase